MHQNPPPPQKTAQRSPWLLAGLMAAVTALVAACRSTPVSTIPPDSRTPGDSTMGPATRTPPVSPPSGARNPKDYRKDAAQHLYDLNAQRIFKGKLPPQLYAIGVLEVNIDRAGRVAGLHWLRAPRHAPEVTAEIERTVRAAAPFPLPSRMSKVTYTETWLWDKSGQFQLDTLTEGQL